MKRVCEDCRGVGFLLMQNDTHGLRIERCDSCRKYRTDDAAVTVAFKAAVNRAIAEALDVAVRKRHSRQRVCRRLMRMAGPGQPGEPVSVGNIRAAARQIANRTERLTPI